MASSFNLPGIRCDNVFSSIAVTILVMISVFVMTVVVEVNCDVGDDCSVNPCGNFEECDAGTCRCQTDDAVQEGVFCRLPKYGEPCVTNCANVFTCTGNVGSKTCDCSTGRFYDTAGGQCENKKAFNASCTLITECKVNLTCINGYCGCTQALHYYDLLFTYDCQLRKDKGESCSDIDNECMTTLSCNGGSCGCGENQYYHESTCHSKNRFDEECSGGIAGECLNTLSCIDQKCGCEQGQYHHQSACLSRKAFDDACSNIENECIDSLFCISSKCKCQQSQYYHQSACHTRKAEGEGCSGITNECINTLSCINDKCGCQQNQYYHQSVCHPKSDHAETCDEDKACFNNDVIQCRDRNGVKKCLCKPGYYYHGPGSTPCLLVSALGVLNLEANAAVNKITLTWSPGMMGSRILWNSMNISPDDGSKNYGPNGGTITGLTSGTKYQIRVESYIDADVNYDRISTSVLVAPDTWTLPSKPGLFDLSASQMVTSPMTFVFTPATGKVKEYLFTVTRNGYVVVTKTVTGTTVTGLYLSPAATYSYEIISVNGNDDRSDKTEGEFSTSAAGKGFDEECSGGIAGECLNTLSCIDQKCGCEQGQYHHQSACLSRKAFDDDCSNIENECIDSLFCISSKCKCQQSQYYHQSACHTRKAEGQGCSGITNECMNTLYCINNVKCGCQQNQYYHQSVCHPRKTRYEGCSTNIPLECMDTLTCTGGQCDCDSNSQYYHNGMCLPRKERYAACTNIQSECKDTLICLGNQCDCDSGSQYYNGLKCVPRKDRYQTCTSTNIPMECQDTLSCIGGMCNCITGTEYFSGGQCRQRKVRTQTCTPGIQYECLDTLECVNGVCSCESTRYLNGGQCLPKKDKEQSCTDSNQCKESLSCVSDVCDCVDEIEYWDGSICQPRKTFQQPCSVSDIINVCLPTLSCIDSQCICDWDTQYRTSEDRCAAKSDHSETCDEDKACFNKDVIQCRERNGVKKCLCKPGYYYHGPGSTPCLLVSALGVLNLEANVAVNKITLTWSPGMMGSRILWNSMNISPDDGSKNYGPNGGTITGLTSGTKYQIRVESYIDADVNYDRISTSVLVTPDTWTLPSKPGLFDLSASQMVTSPMTFVFAPAAGKVKEYIFTLIRNGNVITTKTVTGTTVTGLYLSSAVTYKYEIISVNGNNDRSEKTEGEFSTSAAASSKVVGFAITDKTTSTVELEWNSPSSPNGKILFFFVQIFKDGSCISASYLKCSDCGNPMEPVYTCGPYNYVGDFTASDTQNANKKFTMTVSSLTTYTRYTVKVFAVNKAGDGMVHEETFTTAESAAADLLALNVNGFRSDADTKVGLKVLWTPGAKTGETDYTVTLEDKADGSKTPRTVQGYDNTETIFDNLIAFHHYSVEVYAETKLGKGNPRSVDKKTDTAIPGVVQNVEVIPDPVYAQRMTLKFQCPLEANGIIEEFSILRKDSSDKETTYPVSDFDCSNDVQVSYSQLGNFQIEETYTFNVIAKNQDFSSEESTPASFYTATKTPVFEGKVLTENPDASATKTTITVSLCADCMTNDAQGVVTHAGLIICVKSKTNTCSTSRRKRAIMTVMDYNQYATWAVANSNNFNTVYRTTPNTWLSTLQSDKPKSFIIGNNPTCSSDTTQPTYCNGPLPTGKEIVVTAIACTSAGCRSAEDFVLKTKVPSDSGDDSTGIIVGVVIAVLVIAAVIAVVVFLRLKKKKDKEEPLVRGLTEMINLHKKPIKIRDFKDHVATLHKDGNLLFEYEFEEIKNISADFKFPNEESQKECNGAKTTYSDITPYDHSRVKLASSSFNKSEGSDFINASYIRGLSTECEYIASQTPVRANFPQFWRMVWEQRSKVIVMLSEMKGNMYWPEKQNEEIKYGDISVKLTNSTQLNKCIIRNFKISVGNSKRQVTQLFITDWSDSDFNEDILDFVQLVRSEMTPTSSGPLIVHCSTGVGRTGTFIALDYFMQYIARQSLDDDIDVFGYVLEMRRNRPRMVQAETQYIFIFDALAETIQRKIQLEQGLYESIYPEEVEDNSYTVNIEQDDAYVNDTDSIHEYLTPVADVSHSHSYQNVID